jgi:predicted TIM-barrel fold metal-dependent hydrolase
MHPDESPAAPGSLLSRRHFLVTAAAAVAARPVIRAAEAPQKEIIDANVWLGRWPMRELPLADSPRLEQKLRTLGVTRAWASSLDGLLHKDVASVNARLAEACRTRPFFAPVGVVNLTLPRWEDDLAACAKLQMRGLRLTPAYHGYRLDDARFVEALKLATSLRLGVQLALVLEDERTQSTTWRVPIPDLAPLAPALDTVPGARVMLLNWLPRMVGKPALQRLARAGVVFDISLLEGIAGIETLLEDLPMEHLCFGSYAPVFYPEAAHLKLRESELTAAQLRSITHESALRFLSV